MTENEWFARLNPRRIPEMFKGRLSLRKCYLLSCACALNVPNVLRNSLARQIVETIRNTAFSRSPGQAIQQAVSTVLQHKFPEYFSAQTPLWTLGSRTEFAPDQRTVCNLLGMFLWDPPPTKVVSCCLTTVKQVATQQVRDAITQKAQTHATPPQGIWHSLRVLVGIRPKQTLREAILALAPTEDRERLRALPWSGKSVPQPIAHAIQAAVVRQRVAEASEILVRLAQEVLGSPFHTPAIDPAWLQWNHGAVRHIAKQIAISGDFGDMPILADALEDAGCADEEFLRHCREVRTHAPGCWALDAVLGR